MENFTLATPTKNDHTELLTIWEASVRATHHFLCEGDIGFFKKTIQKEGVFDAVNLTVVRKDQGEILGFMGIAGNSLEMIFLRPEALGRGIGKLLLRHAIEQLHVDRVDVNEQNKAARDFYEHFGFRVMSRSELDGSGKPYPILHMQLGP